MCSWNPDTRVGFEISQTHTYITFYKNMLKLPDDWRIGGKFLGNFSSFSLTFWHYFSLTIMIKLYSVCLCWISFSIVVMVNFDFQLNWTEKHLGDLQSTFPGVSVKMFPELFNLEGSDWLSKLKPRWVHSMVAFGEAGVERRGVTKLEERGPWDTFLTL